MNHGLTTFETSKESAPRGITLAKIRQFARAYSCPASLPPSLGCFVAN